MMSPLFHICNVIRLVLSQRKTLGNGVQFFICPTRRGNSINDFIPKAGIIHFTMLLLIQPFQSSKPWVGGAWLSKVDIESAFRIIPLHPSQWHLLGMSWNGKFYFDKRLTMGGRSSPFEFDKLPTALEWICQYKCLIEYILHLLDDFLTIEPPGDTPTALGILRLVFHQLGVPLAPHKCVGPTHCLEFLGVILDTLQMEAHLSPTKIQKLMNLVTSFCRRKRCTKRELLSLICSFSFAVRVVVPGQTFLSCMIRLSCTVKHLDHFIYLNRGFRDDFDLWEKFLQGWNGKSFFLEDQLTSAPDFEIYTDAAGSVGYGSYFQGHWLNWVWTKEQQLDPKRRISISYQELYPIVLSALL